MCRWTATSLSNASAPGSTPTVFFRRSISKTSSSFDAGPPAVWQFVANAGDGRTVEIELRAEMLEGENTTVFQFSRPTAERAIGKQLPADADVRLTVRFDIEDRNFHWETKRNGGADFHFSTNTHDSSSGPKNQNPIGFAFTPAPDRQLRVFADAGEYHPQPEWCENIPHPVEQTPRPDRQRRRLQSRLV